ncbi:MAG: glycerol-3-phosphate dehydrogenase/oxidase, partial [Chloroflexi bacterium]|nr:glycerol-3-phosphate dehydrogenase/oxidase [Chloroflexota bacterium]
MRRDLGALRDREFDVLIIGGGINGAGAARDAAMRGLRVALVEQGDFGSGTSSRSSKLVHGGVRYLEQLDFKLVLEASLERRVLLRIAPHLVKPLPFILPVFRGDRHAVRTIQLGMWLYDALGLFRNERHRMLTAGEAIALEPGLRAEGLQGAALYYDAQMDDARLCLANAISAVEHGAAAANYLRVTQLIHVAGRVVGAEVRDELRRVSFEVRARHVINTTGPWLDGLCALDGAEPRKVRLSKGTHIVVPALTQRHAITMQSSDERVIFVIPWHGCSLVGTTDSDYSGRPEDVRPEADEVAFLLSEVRRIIPGHTLTRSDVYASFAGLRALVRHGGADTRAVSREERIYESPAGLISVAGGKFTTYRLMAKRLIDRISNTQCRTHLEPLPDGARPHGLEARTRHAVEREMACTVEDVLRRRTQLALGPGQGVGEAEDVARVMAGLLGWDNAERQRQVAAFRLAAG